MLKIEDIKVGDKLEFIDEKAKKQFIEDTGYTKANKRISLNFKPFSVVQWKSPHLVGIKVSTRYGEMIYSEELKYFKKATKEESTVPTSHVNANISDMKEMYTRLLEGEVFIYEDAEVKYNKDSGCFMYEDGLLTYYRTKFKDFLIEKPWTAFVSEENPILCRVDNNNGRDSESPVYKLVIGYCKYDDHPYITHLSAYGKAEPVKPSECFQG